MFNRMINNTFEELSKNIYLRGLCNTFIMLLPIPVISALCEVLSSFFAGGEFHRFSLFMELVSESTRSLYPVLLLTYFSLFLSKKEGVSRILVITSSLVIVLIICKTCKVIDSTALLNMNIPFFMAVLIPVFVSKLIFYIQSKKWFMRSELPSVIDQSINLVGITLLVIVIIGLPAFYLSCFVMTETVNWFIHYDINPIFNALILETSRNLLWFIGMNGHAVLSGSSAGLDCSHSVAITDIQCHSVHIVNSLFLTAYASIGGAGNSLSLVICMLLTKNKGYRRLGAVSLIFSFFNINELVIYGLPVMFNPILIIPFIMVPILSLSLAYLVTTLGLVTPVTIPISWMTPTLFSGYLSTDGDMNAVVLQAVIVILGIFIYYPFFRRMDSIKMANIVYSKSISDNYFDYDKSDESKSIGGMLPAMNQNILAQNRINKLQRSGDFVLFYQPQYNFITKNIVSIEALIRHRDRQGKITPPIFIDDFNKVGLASVLDFWVLHRALTETATIIKEFGITVSINVSPVTFIRKDFFYAVKEEIEKVEVPFSSIILEITEDVLIKDEFNTAKTIKKFRALGVKIALDDFGSGYSSLGYLSKYKFDIVKIDRTLTMNTYNKIGAELFSLTCQIVRTLGAKIVVEGVEKQCEVELMKKEQINTAQGFFFSRPKPIEKIDFTENVQL
ncbi:EAL domain-containing protein [Moritella sp. 28]|uniref:EAL domain-containing protein n=1 Tax=Moritella sp. 28 TaxID=2746232 RepID=UPI001BA69CFB|nr:EAL domain-containing protein [Moritella sp. 28]QUM86242.1 PTS sugar transporter subunit IIC/EAL domain-containing protein [Moritella sp. 28]